MTFLYAFLIGAAIVAVGSPHPIHALLALIQVFFLASTVLMVLQIDYLALLFVIVYVGAITVLFLFIIMMLEIRGIHTATRFGDVLSYKILILVLFIMELILLLGANLFGAEFPIEALINTSLDFYSLREANSFIDYSILLKEPDLLRALAGVLFTEYAGALIAITILLLLAMVGGITLVLDRAETEGVRGQKPELQAMHTPRISVIVLGLYPNLYTHFGILLDLGLAFGISLLLIALSYLLTVHLPDAEKTTSYECGFELFGDARRRFTVAFYVVAILFLIFDVEVALLFPWALTLSMPGGPGFIVILLFLILLALGFVFEVGKGALDLYRAPLIEKTSKDFLSTTISGAMILMPTSDLWPSFVGYGITILLGGVAIVLPLLLAVAFLTLVERQLLAGLQRRQGPNIVGFFGILQAVADGVKLLLKEAVIPRSANSLIFVLAPTFTFALAVAGWMFVPFLEGGALCDFKLGLLAIFALSSLGVHTIIMAGWSSNSKYAFLGGLRSAAQMISYEVSFGVLLLTVLLLSGSLSLSGMTEAQQNFWFLLPLLPVAVGFFISILAETNRHPFDLPEAEAELVSGYNVEYAAMGFALFFLAEYGNIILMSALTSLLFLGGWWSLFEFFPFTLVPTLLWLPLKAFFIIYGFILVRGAFPRYRYDMLMRLGWKVLLPFSLAAVTLYAALLLDFNGGVEFSSMFISFLFIYKPYSLSLLKKKWKSFIMFFFKKLIFINT